MAELAPERQLVDRFRADLDPLAQPTTRLGLAVSGGPDSLALLLLAAAARPGQVEAATVDHGLRREAAAEAELVEAACDRLQVPHTLLRIEWDLPPSSAIQEQAREVRYAALAAWMRECSLGALVTGHHLDDQAETVMMRLARGSGVRGLKGMQPASNVPGHPNLKLLRPLLGWRRSELERICASAGLSPAADPGNSDEQFERVRVRRALADAGLLDPQALARSAANLGAADEAVDWAAREEWAARVEENPREIRYRPSDAPAEVRRRVVTRAIGALATEGTGEELRGGELDRLLGTLQSGGIATLRGVRCSGGTEWRFTPLAPRNSR